MDRAELVRSHEVAAEMVEQMGDDALLLLRWHGAVIVGSTLREAVFRTLLAEQHAHMLLTSLSHGRPLAPVPVARGPLYEDVLSPATHDLHWHFQRTFVDPAERTLVDLND